VIQHLDLDAGAVWPDVYERLVERSLDVVSVRGVADAMTCAALVERLEAPEVSGRAELRDRAGDGTPQVSVLGVAVSPSAVCPTGPDPAAYFAAAEPFAAWLGEIAAPVEAAHRVLAALSGATVTRGRYGAATLRRVPAGCEMGFHCENAYAAIAVYDDLRAVARLARQTSWFLVLGAPARGGELEVTDVSWEANGRVRPEDVAARAGDIGRFAAAPGDLWLLRSGDLYHRIAPVESGVRWTLGGFCAPAQQGPELWAWG
jgi:hypothetical protein